MRTIENRGSRNRRFVAVMLAAGLSSIPLASAGAQQAVAVDTAAAAAALHDVDAVCAADNGALWGRSICGRLILIDPRARVAVANHSDSQHRLRPWQGAFVGPWIDSMGRSNTSIRWDGSAWATVLLPLPRDRYTRVALVLHEAFHRIQRQLELGSSDPVSTHLDEREGRYWLRLELRALAAALTSDDAHARIHARDALLFRAERQRLFPGADTTEPALEIQEGLAEYSGQRLAMTATGEPMDRVAKYLDEWQATQSYPRSFAYATGPALGFVLDRFDAKWRSKVVVRRNLAALLADAVGAPAEPIQAQAIERAKLYGADVIASAEDARESARRARLKAYTARLVDGPVLNAHQQFLQLLNFDPNAVVVFPPGGTVYPTGTFGGPWGRLTIDSGGVVVSPDFKSIRVAAPRDTTARPLRGDGWTLVLNPGWVIRPGQRAGDIELVPPG
jgi:hypothetical protein